MSAAPDDGTVPGVCLRIAVDGPPGAGRTTTVRTLADRLGHTVATVAVDVGDAHVEVERLEYVGGRFEGEPIRAQVVTTPSGHPAAGAAFLADAHVVLVVCDSTAAGIDPSADVVTIVRSLAASGLAPRGLVLQANRRDDTTAVPLDELRRQLDVHEDDVVIETVATTGDGVRQAFVYAVREGLRHLPGRAGGPDLWGSADAVAARLHGVLAEDPPAACRDGVDHVDRAERTDCGTTIDEEVAPPPDALPPRDPLAALVSWAAGRVPPEAVPVTAGPVGWTAEPAASDDASVLTSQVDLWASTWDPPTPPTTGPWPTPHDDPADGPAPADDGEPGGPPIDPSIDPSIRGVDPTGRNRRWWRARRSG